MTIIKTPAYQTPDGVPHATMEAAQTHALTQLIGKETADAEVITGFVITHKAEVLAILSSTGRKPRKRTKAAKPKKSKAAPTPISTTKEAAPSDAPF